MRRRSARPPGCARRPWTCPTGGSQRGRRAGQPPAPGRARRPGPQLRRAAGRRAPACPGAGRGPPALRPGRWSRAGWSRRRSPAVTGPRRAHAAARPSAATIAPLSVHRPGRGTRSVMPAASHRCAASARSRELAATPPPMTRWSDAVLPARVDGLAGQHVGHGLLERGRHVGHRHRLAGRLAGLDPAGHRGLQPGEGEVKAVARPGTCRAGTRSPAGRPSRAARSISGPPGNGEPEHPGHLVEGLARRVVDGRAQRHAPRRPRRGTSSSEEWPPDTSSAMAGAGSGPCSSWSTATCAARWLTPYSGLPRASA